jgi:predicted deacetylase
MTSVCFRFDDPSAISDHSLEQEILDVFAEQGASVCVAAIPFARGADGETVPLSPRNATHLVDAARASLVEIAQHGHSHVQRGVDAKGRRSEFAGVPYEEQVRLIAEGARQLSATFNVDVAGFVPPWNTYDHETVRALTEAAFAFLSAGDEVIRSEALPMVPRTCTLRNARDVIDRALQFQALAPVVVVVFHADEFREFKLPPAIDEPPPFTDLDELRALLRWIRKKLVRIEKLGAVADSVRRGEPLQNVSELKLPWRIKERLPPILVRSGHWSTLRGVIWRSLRR